MTKSRSDPKMSTDRFLRRTYMVLGLVLATAGAARLYESLSAIQEDDWATLLQLLLSEAELIGGLWLLVAAQAGPAHPWVTAAFVGFWATSACQVLGGRCSCGCFGSLSINPWCGLAFDLAVVVLLLRLRPVDRSTEDRSLSASRLGALLLIAAILGVAASWIPPLVTVSGFATLRGQPLRDVPLEFSVDSAHTTVLTDHEGSFSLPPLRPGHYPVSLLDRSRLLGPQPTYVRREAAKVPPAGAANAPAESVRREAAQRFPTVSASD